MDYRIADRSVIACLSSYNDMLTSGKEMNKKRNKNTTLIKMKSSTLRADKNIFPSVSFFVLRSYFVVHFKVSKLHRCVEPFFFYIVFSGQNDEQII